MSEEGLRVAVIFLFAFGAGIGFFVARLLF
jgi:hypothetical protein